jgi:predicted PurR-regulated permease PerM
MSGAALRVAADNWQARPMHDVAGSRSPGGAAARNVLVLAVVLALVGLALPFFAAIPGLMATVAAAAVLRRLQRAGHPSKLAVIALVIGLATLALGVLWFSVAFLVSGTAIFADA